MCEQGWIIRTGYWTEKRLPVIVKVITAAAQEILADQQGMMRLMIQVKLLFDSCCSCPPDQTARYTSPPLHSLLVPGSLFCVKLL